MVSFIHDMLSFINFHSKFPLETVATPPPGPYLLLPAKDTLFFKILKVFLKYLFCMYECLSVCIFVLQLCWKRVLNSLELDLRVFVSIHVVAGT